LQLTGLFKKPKNELEKGGKIFEAPDEVKIACSICGTENSQSELSENMNVCRCGHHFRISARQRIAFFVDAGSFMELYQDMVSEDILSFDGYKKKLKSAQIDSKELEAVICGEAEIGGRQCALFVMEPAFMLASMGTVVGEKLTRLFELATEKSLPVVGFTASGGARMQEGILSLMQMAKVSAALKRHSDAGNLYITALTDPTMGGVTASFAMDGDIIISEPGAMIGFAGARVIEQAIRERLPEGFQRAEFLLQHGFVDMIVSRMEQKERIAKILALHTKTGERI